MLGFPVISNLHGGIGRFVHEIHCSLYSFGGWSHRAPLTLKGIRSDLLPKICLDHAIVLLGSRSTVRLTYEGYGILCWMFVRRVGGASMENFVTDSGASGLFTNAGGYGMLLLGLLKLISSLEFCFWR